MAIWYILWPFGTFYGHLAYVIFDTLVCCTKKNLAALQVQILLSFLPRETRANCERLFRQPGIDPSTNFHLATKTGFARRTHLSYFPPKQ
jgi:hypothetical protein